MMLVVYGETSPAEEAARQQEREDLHRDHQFVGHCLRGENVAVQEMLSGPHAEQLKQATSGQLNFEGSTCAHQAVRGRTNGYLTILDAIIKSGHPVDVPDQNSGSGFSKVPLFIAVENLDQAAFDLLLPHTNTFAGVTPRGNDIEYVACIAKKHPTMCKALEGKGNTEAVLAELKRRKNESLNTIREARNIPLWVPEL